MSSSIDSSQFQQRTVKAWIVTKPGGPFELGDVTLPPLLPDEVEVKITHCGVCAWDVDSAAGKYGPMMKFPGCCGHEGAGVVTLVGSLVTTIPLGSRVGIGAYRQSCGICMLCTNGKSNLCSKHVITFLDGPNSQPGAFSSYVRIKATHAIPIPDKIASRDAGPLMCAGITVFAPFRNHNILSGETVGVVGLGGLGSLAIQIGRAHGCEMIAMSSNASKKSLALNELGAHGYIDMSNAEEMKESANRLNYIIVTSCAPSLPWQQLLSCLTSAGKIIIVGVIHEPINISALQLIMGQKSICGSSNGSPGLILDLLRLAALHQIKPMIETFPFSQINNVAQKMKDNTIRFRGVLEHPQEY